MALTKNEHANNIHTNGALTVLERVNQPDTAAALNRLLDRIDALEQAVTTLADTIQQAPAVMAMAGDMVDEAWRMAAAQGIDLEARARTGLRLLNKLTEPQVVSQFEQMLALAHQAPGLVAMLGDMADEAYRDAAAAGLDIEAVAATGISFGRALVAAQTMPTQPLGPLGLFSTLRDPEVQKALGFLMNVVRQLGKTLP